MKCVVQEGGSWCGLGAARGLWLQAALNQIKMAAQGEHVVGLLLLWRLLFVLPFLVVFSNLKNKMSLMKTDVLLPCIWKKSTNKTHPKIE